LLKINEMGESRSRPYDVDVTATVSQQELEAAHCWEVDDHVPKRPAMTEFRRRLRFHQAQWREAHGQPDRYAADRTEARRQAGASCRKSAPTRLRAPRPERTLRHRRCASRRRGPGHRLTEPHQSFDHQRLWADLLWSPALAFNLFGGPGGATSCSPTGQSKPGGRMRRAPYPRCALSAHSPGTPRSDIPQQPARPSMRLFVLDVDDGTKGILGVKTKYHEWGKPETPKPRKPPAQTGKSPKDLAPFAAGAVDCTQRHDGSRHDVARALAAAVDAPACE